MRFSPYIASSVIAAFGLLNGCAGPREVGAFSERRSLNEPVSHREALSPYGEWVQLADHGQVWRPYTDAVGAGFAPYSTGGRWVATQHGWVFDSTYPFGPVVFHYGRWFMSSSLGWVWAPGDVWGPSWVSWRQGPGYVCWSPLPPAHFSGYGAHWYLVDSRYFPHGHPSYGYRRASGAEASRLVHNALPVRVVTSPEGQAWHPGPDVEEVARESARPIVERRIDVPHLPRSAAALPADAPLTPGSIPPDPSGPPRPSAREFGEAPRASPLEDPTRIRPDSFDAPVREGRSARDRAENARRRGAEGSESDSPEWLPGDRREDAPDDSDRPARVIPESPRVQPDAFPPPPRARPESWPLPPRAEPPTRALPELSPPRAEPPPRAQPELSPPRAEPPPRALPELSPPRAEPPPRALPELSPPRAEPPPRARPEALSPPPRATPEPSSPEPMRPPPRVMPEPPPVRAEPPPRVMPEPPERERREPPRVIPERPRSDSPAGRFPGGDRRPSRPRR